MLTAHTPIPQQEKTFRRVTRAEQEGFKQGRGRPKKAEADKDWLKILAQFIDNL